MPATVSHNLSATTPDDVNYEIQPKHWNSGHDVTLNRRPQARAQESKLQKKLVRKKQQLKSVAKQIEKIDQRIELPEGILAHREFLTAKASELRKDIEIIAVDLIAVKDFLGSLHFGDVDDEDDVEVILFDS